MKKMTIDDKLALDLFHTDEENAHIQINKACKDEAEIRKVVLACPTGRQIGRASCRERV